MRRGTLIAVIVLFVIIVVAALFQTIWVKGYRRSPFPSSPPSPGTPVTTTP